jgi:hypothetical protein
MIHFVVTIMSYRLQASLHHVDAVSTAQRDNNISQRCGTGLTPCIL